MDEDNKQLSLADHVASMLQSEGWKYAKSKFDQRILDLQNINNLDLTKPEVINVQILARKMAVDEMWAWLRGDVEGFVEQQKVANEKLQEQGESYIGRE